jgi:hypothetical protein
MIKISYTFTQTTKIYLNKYVKDRWTVKLNYYEDDNKLKCLADPNINYHINVRRYHWIIQQHNG